MKTHRDILKKFIGGGEFEEPTMVQDNVRSQIDVQGNIDRKSFFDTQREIFEKKKAYDAWRQGKGLDVDYEEDFGNIDYPRTNLLRGDNIAPNTAWMYPNLKGKTQASATQLANEDLAFEVLTAGMISKALKGSKAISGLMRGMPKGNVTKGLNKFIGKTDDIGKSKKINKFVNQFQSNIDNQTLGTLNQNQINPNRMHIEEVLQQRTTPEINDIYSIVTKNNSGKTKVGHNIVDNIPKEDKLVMLNQEGDLVHRMGDFKGWHVENGKLYKLNSGSEKKSLHFSGSGKQVESHTHGAWDADATTIITPFRDFGVYNGMPRSTAINDTYWWNPRQYEFPKNTKILTGDREIYNTLKKEGISVEFNSDVYKIQQKIKQIQKKYKDDYGGLIKDTEFKDLVAQNKKIHTEWINKQNPKPISNFDRNINLGHNEAKFKGARVLEDPTDFRNPRSFSETPYVHSEDIINQQWKSKSPKHKFEYDELDRKNTLEYYKELNENIAIHKGKSNPLEYDRYVNGLKNKDYKLSHTDKILIQQKILNTKDDVFLRKYLGELEKLPYLTEELHFTGNAIIEKLTTGKPIYRYSLGGAVGASGALSQEEFKKDGEVLKKFIGGGEFEEPTMAQDNVRQNDFRQDYKYFDTMKRAMDIAGRRNPLSPTSVSFRDKLTEDESLMFKQEMGMPYHDFRMTYDKDYNRSIREQERKAELKSKDPYFTGEKTIGGMNWTDDSREALLNKQAKAQLDWEDSPLDHKINVIGAEALLAGVTDFGLGSKAISGLMRGMPKGNVTKGLNKFIGKTDDVKPLASSVDDVGNYKVSNSKLNKSVKSINEEIEVEDFFLLKPKKTSSQIININIDNSNVQRNIADKNPLETGRLMNIYEKPMQGIFGSHWGRVEYPAIKNKAIDLINNYEFSQNVINSRIKRLEDISSELKKNLKTIHITDKVQHKKSNFLREMLMLDDKVVGTTHEMSNNIFNQRRLMSQHIEEIEKKLHEIKNAPRFTSGSVKYANKKELKAMKEFEETLIRHQNYDRIFMAEFDKPNVKLSAEHGRYYNDGRFIPTILENKAFVSRATNPSEAFETTLHELGHKIDDTRNFFTNSDKNLIESIINSNNIKDKDLLNELEVFNYKEILADIRPLRVAIGDYTGNMMYSKEILDKFFISSKQKELPSRLNQLFKLNVLDTKQLARILNYYKSISIPALGTAGALSQEEFKKGGEVLRKFIQGGENMEQQGQEQQILQAVIEMLQQGISPEDIYQELVNQGIPEQDAQMIIQSVMEQSQGEASLEQYADGRTVTEHNRIDNLPYGDFSEARESWKNVAKNFSFDNNTGTFSTPLKGVGQAFKDTFTDANINTVMRVANQAGDPRNMMWALPDKGLGSNLKKWSGLAAGLSGSYLGYRNLFNKKDVNTIGKPETPQSIGYKPDLDKSFEDMVRSKGHGTRMSGSAYNDMSLENRFYKNNSFNRKLEGPYDSKKRATTSNFFQDMHKDKIQEYDNKLISKTEEDWYGSMKQPTGVPFSDGYYKKGGTLKKYFYGGDNPPYGNLKYNMGVPNNSFNQYMTNYKNLGQNERMPNLNYNNQLSPSLPKNNSQRYLENQWHSSIMNFDNIESPYNDNYHPDFTGKLIESQRPATDIYNAEIKGLKNNPRGPFGEKFHKIPRAKINMNIPNEFNFSDKLGEYQLSPEEQQEQQRRITTRRGDGSNFQAAMNSIIGFSMFNDVAEAEDYERQYNQKLRKTGNTMNRYNPNTPTNPFGDYTLNTGIFQPAKMGHTQDFGTNMKYGGTKKKYNEGGEYRLSQQEIQELIKQGYDIEFLD